jgi:hypothetical protein
LFHTYKNAKAHLTHNAKCLRRVTELATSKRNATGRFVTIEQLGIVEVKFNTRSNFVGGAGVVSREGRELLKEFQVLYNIVE